MWIATRKGPTQLIRSRHYFDGEWHVLLCKYCGFAISWAENDTMGSMLELGGVEAENFVRTIVGNVITTGGVVKEPCSGRHPTTRGSVVVLQCTSTSDVNVLSSAVNWNVPARRASNSG